MTKFSDFIRNASDEEKEKVYSEVIDTSIKEQKKVMCMDTKAEREKLEQMFHDEAFYSVVDLCRKALDTIDKQAERIAELEALLRTLRRAKDLDWENGINQTR